jgi:hypothetical protein
MTRQKSRKQKLAEWYAWRDRQNREYFDTISHRIELTYDNNFVIAEMSIHDRSDKVWRQIAQAGDDCDYKPLGA